MEFHAGCQALETGFNVKFAKKYCPESKNPEQYSFYHKIKDLSTLIAQDFVIARTIFIANASVILYNKFTLLILE